MLVALDAGFDDVDAGASVAFVGDGVVLLAMCFVLGNWQKPGP